MAANYKWEEVSGRGGPATLFQIKYHEELVHKSLMLLSTETKIKWRVCGIRLFFLKPEVNLSLINMLIISWQIYAHCIASRIKTFTQYNTERSGHVSEALIRETYRWLWLEGQASQESWVEEILQGVIQFSEHHAGVINDII